MTEGGAVVRRRRECTACGRRFTTKERTDSELRLSVIKRDGTRVPYDRERVYRGLRQACYKLPVNEETLERLVDAVEGDVVEHFEKAVTTIQLGELVLRRLRMLNPVAYVRFASVFHRYRDVDEFIQEIQRVRDLVALHDPNQRFLFDG